MESASTSFFEAYFDGIGIGMSGEFTSISGLNIEFEWETYSEGGTNYPRRFFKGIVPQTLVLEQGTVTNIDEFSNWLVTINNGITKTLDGTIMLRNSYGDVLRQWTVVGALPTKYIGPTLNSLSQAQLAVTRIELLHNGCF
ncbi:MAG: phage tail protein [Oscillospiraceae bacterium]|jgi:phage tail-like protein|nr:phage tail protein [Oscillospiraceae bacterium]